MIRRLSLILLLLAPLIALAQRPPARIPTRADEVLEHLPAGYAALEPTGDRRPVSLDYARQLLATAARTGDARLATRADALLDRFPNGDANPEWLRLRAFSAQHRHDFAGARQWLDRLVSLDPRDGDARLSRAQLDLVQGRIDHARSSCAALALGIDGGRGLLCIAALSLRTDNLATADEMLERWLAQAPAKDPSRQYALLMRAESSARAGAVDADERFRQALAIDPGSVTALAATARQLRRSGHPEQTLALLAKAPNTDHLLLERALAARSRPLIDELARRYALAHELGSQPERRDEAEYLLELRGDAEGALALAQENFRNQRDAEDVDLLVRAAAAAHRPEALEPMRQWAQSQHLIQPTLPANRRDRS